VTQQRRSEHELVISIKIQFTHLSAGPAHHSRAVQRGCNITLPVSLTLIAHHSVIDAAAAAMALAYRTPVAHVPTPSSFPELPVSCRAMAYLIPPRLSPFQIKLNLLNQIDTVRECNIQTDRQTDKHGRCHAESFKLLKPRRRSANEKSHSLKTEILKVHETQQYVFSYVFCCFFAVFICLYVSFSLLPLVGE